MIRPVFAVAVLSLALSGCSSSPRPEAAKAKDPPQLPPDVQTVAAIARPEEPTASPTVEASVEATGEFISPVRSELVSRLPGRVARIDVDQGARVVKGQRLLELETDYLRLDVERTKADLARASATLADAQRDYDRKKELIAKGSVSQAAFDRSRASWEGALANRDSAQAAADLGAQRLSDAVLVSPIDGVVLERRADVGQRLGDDTVAFVIVQTAPLKLRFRVPERFIPSVRPGLAVRARVDPYPKETFDGKVAVVGEAVDPASRTILVEAEFSNRDGRLRSGLFARVALDLAKSPKG